MEAKKYVLLIDGDNVNWSYMAPIKEYVSQCHGSIEGIHLFGKLNSPFLNDWKQLYSETDELITYNVSSTKKNSTDMHMLGVVLRLYYEKNIHNFIVMSSDSDMESVVNCLPADADITICYSPRKTSQVYLNFLKQRKIDCIDLDALRGPLKKDQINVIVNSVARSYVKFKLSPEYFSYKAIKEWIIDRYPELDYLTVEEIVKNMQEITLHFGDGGVIM